MNFAIVGCGYVAEQYGRTFGNYPELRLVGAWDQNPRNLAAFVGAPAWRTRAYASLEELTSDPAVELVLNLTNPRSHLEVTRACLEAGKHVYSEKPLAMTAEEARSLADLARSRGLALCSAPCSVLGETAQTLWKAIREGAVGRVRLVYANFDDGMIAPAQAPWTWTNELGVPWPAKDEFEVGCTYEHGGYVLTWLLTFFGPVRKVTSFASCQLPDKGIPVDGMAPDFVVGCLELGQGVVARVTCGLVAPTDKSMLVVGDEGSLFVGNVRNDAGPVLVRPARPGRWEARLRRHAPWVYGWLEGRFGGAPGAALFQRSYPLVRTPPGRFVSAAKPVDFMRGPAELAHALRERRRPRLSADLGAHVVEVVEALQYPGRHGPGPVEPRTTFEAESPLPWAL